MAHALALGRRNRGTTWPNPSVGCVIVSRDEGPAKVLARGWTARGGRPHAEVLALEAAGPRARGASAYVSLEPCSHHGETPPCAEALLQAGVARVVTALDDPDPRVAGGGHEALRAAGVEVVTGVLARCAAVDHAGFLSRVRRSRPHVHLKLAVSRDGRIAYPDPARKKVTGSLARARAHLMRAHSDAVLIGKDTALADDPRLTCRLPGLQDRSPVRVIADSGLELPPGSNLVRSIDEAPLWLLCVHDADPARKATMSAAGAEVITCPAGRQGRVDLAAGLTALAERGITRLLVEGGAQLAAALFDLDLVDEVSLFEAPHEIGPGGLEALAGHALAEITDSPRFAQCDRFAVGPDMLTSYWRRREG